MKVSRLCLGTMSYGSSAWRDWVLDEQESRPFFKQALEAGINFFDTADMYSLGRSEEVTGRALRDFAVRDEVIIATKVYNPMKEDPNARGLSRKHILDSVDASLRRLGTDYIDLYQIHRWDNETPIEETLQALDDLVRWGKVRYIGASSMYAWQFCKALYTSRLHGFSEFVSMQNQYNAVYREEEREMIPLCRDQGIALIPWSPMARGFLARSAEKQQQQETTRRQTDGLANEWYVLEQDRRIRERVLELAQSHGVKPAQIALAWLLGQPGITAPIIGATKEGHIRDAAGALELRLSEEELQYLREPYGPRQVIGRLSDPNEALGR
jgi:aryl-alcohol dehydrogenase (NADP+)